MKRFTLVCSALAVATTLLVSGGPAVESAEARSCNRVDHPRDPGWATYCSDGGGKIAICDRQADGHDTYVRYWKKGVGVNQVPKDSQPIPGGSIYNPSDALISARDTFGRRDGYGRRVPQFCTIERNLGFQPVAFAVCVTRERCSRPRPIGGG